MLVERFLSLRSQIMKSIQLVLATASTTNKRAEEDIWMKAISFPKLAEVKFASLEDPVAGVGEVLVQVEASGICHPDFEVLSANYGDGA